MSDEKLEKLTKRYVDNQTGDVYSSNRKIKRLARYVRKLEGNNLKDAIKYVNSKIFESRVFNGSLENDLRYKIDNLKDFDFDFELYQDILNTFSKYGLNYNEVKFLDDETKNNVLGTKDKKLEKIVSNYINFKDLENDFNPFEKKDFGNGVREYVFQDFFDRIGWNAEDVKKREIVWNQSHACKNIYDSFKRTSNFVRRIEFQKGVDCEDVQLSLAGNLWLSLLTPVGFVFGLMFNFPLILKMKWGYDKRKLLKKIDNLEGEINEN